jgi:hypothetical protein
VFVTRWICVLLRSFWKTKHVARFSRSLERDPEVTRTFYAARR